MEHIYGFIFLATFWVLAFLAIKFWNKGSVEKCSVFLLSNRNLRFFPGAVSVAAAWIWAPALFVASQKAYEQGVAGLFWFVFPNSLALILFAFLAKRMRKIFKNGFTLPEYMQVRFGDKFRSLYVIAIFIIQIYSVILQVTAALLLLNILTGIDKNILILILGTIILSLSVIAGFRSSLAADSIKATFIFLVGVIFIPWALHDSGGAVNILNGISGATGNFGSIFDRNIILAFGIPISISLLSGVVIDQQQWQRAFAIKEESVKKSFVLGAVLFSFVPILLGLLGFAAAGSGIEVGSTQTQLAGVMLIKNYLPQVGLYFFAFMILSGLIAAGMAALSAVGSIGAIDIFRSISKNMPDKKVIFFSRITMIVTLLLGVGIALIPKIQIVYLVLLIGAFRGSLMMPTIFSLFWKRMSANLSFVGIILGMLVGIPLFIYGSIKNIALITSLGSLIPIIISTVFCILSVLIKPSKFNYNRISE